MIDFLGEFHLEGATHCHYDYIEISATIDFESSTGKYCSDTKPTKMEIKTNIVRIKFSSDYGVTRKGFSFKVTEKEPDDGKYL